MFLTVVFSGDAVGSFGQMLMSMFSFVTSCPLCAESSLPVTVTARSHRGTFPEVLLGRARVLGGGGFQAHKELQALVLMPAMGGRLCFYFCHT